ncbi:MAG TPA: hypothetical protein VFT95_11025, partial [Micromonosporaceae bacterium]|nr:hypothetical protein [Micromonosporaceae bacterium]
RPTIQARTEPRVAPWNPRSIVYAAFFGGPLAATVLGVLNVRRLAAGPAAAAAILAAGVAAIGARFGIAATMGERPGAQIARGLCGVAVWGVVMLVQKRPFRVWSLAHERDHASLLWPGLAAAIGCGVLEYAAILLLLGAV